MNTFFFLELVRYHDEGWMRDFPKQVRLIRINPDYPENFAHGTPTPDDFVGIKSKGLECLKMIEEELIKLGAYKTN